MARHHKREKVIRSYDGIDREESTVGLMVLRVFIIIVMIFFIIGASVLFALNFQREAVNAPQSSVPNVDAGAFYQKYDTDVEDKLLEYCNNSVSISKYNNVDLVSYNDNIQISGLMKTSLDRMLEDAEKDGVEINVVRGYLSYDECSAMYKTFLIDFENNGATPAEAELKARAVFPPGGNNEFQTGMLVKLSDEESASFAKTNVYAWLYKNGINYGFINRYTEDKIDYTGINEDLTVYRFVGTENAQKMRSFGMCLEEYSDYCSYR